MKIHCKSGLWLIVTAFALAAPDVFSDVVLVKPDDPWQYRKGTNAPQADWKTASDSALDPTWATGNGGFGYADNAAEVQACQTLLTDMEGKYTTVALRKSFDVPVELDPALSLELTMDYDDGFIAWLDGVFLASANSPDSPGEPAYNAVATASHESSRGNNGRPPSTFDSGPIGTRLAAGRHVLAVLGLNQSLSSSDFVQIATLAAVTKPLPPTNCLSGLISVDTTLHATNSPYAICGDLTISTNVTLTVEPGTTVQMDSGVNLAVANGGRLLAEGTETSPIHFARMPGVAAWGGLTILGGVGSPETRIAYADFEGNSTVCIEVAGGTLNLNHSTFLTTTHQYVGLDSSSFLISHCVFPTSSATFELVHGTGGIKSGGRGIVRDCFFGSTSGYNDIMDFTGGNRPNHPLVQFYNNVFSGATDDILDLDGTDAWIEGNIFLHAHKNGAPDSAAAVSGGNSGGDTSEVTIIRNLFFDCDQAATAKQGNFYVLLNNTIVHMTKTGGLDTAGGAVNVRDLDPGPPTTFAAGYYLEGNIIADVEQLVRNYDPAQTLVSFVNNLLPMPWAGPGSSNRVADPMLKHIPELTETAFTNWTSAQVLWDWFSLLPGSPGLASGPDGWDQGGAIPPGVALVGEPPATTDQTSATVSVGPNRRGLVPVVSWPDGAGYVGYKWQLDGGPWSAEFPVTSPIVLTNLAPGPHQLAVLGKNDAGTFQNDPVLGTNAVVTLSRVWTVQASFGLTSASRVGNEVVLQVSGQGGKTYAVEFTDSLATPSWAKLADVTVDPRTGQGTLSAPLNSAAARFFRLSAASP